MLDFPDLVRAKPLAYQRDTSDLAIFLGYDERLIQQAYAEFKRLALAGHDHAALVQVREPNGYALKAFPTLSETSWRGVPDEYRMQGGPIWSTGRLAPPEARMLSRDANEIPASSTAGALFKYPNAGFRIKAYFWSKAEAADGALARLKMRRDGSEQIMTIDVFVSRADLNEVSDLSSLWTMKLGRYAREAGLALDHLKPIVDFVVACQSADKSQATV